MKNLLFLASIFLFVIPCRAAEPAASPSENQVIRQAITTFRQRPVSQDGRLAGEMVRKFAEKDASVVINVNSKVAPFLNNVKLPSEDRALFLDAYLIGSIDSQLLRNEKKDDPCGGVTEVIQ